MSNTSAPASSRLFIWALVASLSGFLFGFDTVVISGAEQKIQALWGLSAGMHGLAMSAALWGTVLGAICGGWPTDRYGRRKTLLWVGVLYLSSAIWSAFATDVHSFIIARFIGGVGVGISTIAAPLYIAEIAPPERRGRLAAMFQFNIVFGILVAFMSNALLSGVGEHDWRWMLGVEAFPAIAFTALCFLLPESPRWLITHASRRDEAIDVLTRARPGKSREEILAEADRIAESRVNEVAVERFWTRRLTTPIVLAFLIAFFNQLSGINAILYFAPRIFALSGMEESAALLQSVGIGVTNLIFTFLGLWLIDRLGRRTLLTIGSFGYIVSLGLCSWAFFTETYSIVPLTIFAFIAAHAIGSGAVIWVFISEIFPNQHRATGQALGSSTHWVFAALLTLFFPKLVTAFHPGYVFLFFGFMMFLQLLWVRFMVRETKGIALEDVARKLEVSA
jgi:sugar porter (SP) family MFS transporter